MMKVISKFDSVSRCQDAIAMQFELREKSGYRRASFRSGTQGACSAGRAGAEDEFSEDSLYSIDHVNVISENQTFCVLPVKAADDQSELITQREARSLLFLPLPALLLLVPAWHTLASRTS